MSAKARATAMAAEEGGDGQHSGKHHGRGGVEFALDENRTLKQVLGGEAAMAADVADDDSAPAVA